MSLTKYCVSLLLLAAAALASPTPDINEARDILSLEDNIMDYLKTQEFSLDLPFVGTQVTLGARNLNEDEIDLKVKVSSVEEARKKSKLKKIFAPILILVILKAITLIPLALGILGLKTWNAIQLSFVTFVVSISLAVYELCKKVASDHSHPIIAHSAPWSAARSINDNAQELAYSSYFR